MTDKVGNFIENVDFSKEKTAGDVMNIFIKVAKTCPNQASALFDKYVSFMKSEHPQLTMNEIRTTVANNISMLSGYYGKKTSKLLYKVYEALRQY